MKERTNPSKNQAGISMLGFLFYGGAIILGIITMMRCAPAWIENAAIEKTIQKMESSGETSITVLKQNFASNAAINDIKSLTADDLVFSVDSGKLNISYNYEARVEISKKIALVFNFNHE